ncbi:restriction endonuclease subunit S [Flavobacteriaceae bacterium]|nr:restriction endonuclease subunit S [Flavobacteriaceae bacterium]
MSTYPTYKNSGIAWLGDIPEHWEVNRLKNITAKSIGGVWGDEPNEDGKDTIVVRVADFDRDKASIIDSEEFTYRAISENHLLDRKLNKNDILLEKSGGGEKQLVGKAVIFDKDFDAVCANFIQKVEIIERFDKRFILHVFTSIYDGRINFPYVNQTTGIQNLDITAFFNHCISYPKSKEKQTAIANYLDKKTSKLDQLISNKKDQIDKLKEIRQIEINTAVTKGLDPNVTLKPSGIEWLGDIPKHWELWKLSSKFKDISSGTTPQAGSDRFYEKGKYPWINTGDLNDSFLHACKRKVTQTALDEHSVLKLHPPGVLIMAMYGATIGKLGITSFKACCNQACCVIGQSKSIDTKYLFYWLMGNRIEIVNRAYGGGQPNISQDVIKRLRITCPPPNEQTAIANYLDEKTSKLDQLVSNLENQIEQLQEVRKIEIYNAVTGKIKVA